MKQEDIIRMAREAGFPTDYNDKRLLHNNELEHFAKLVAAAEREACAKMCDEEANDGSEGEWDTVCEFLADKIRARGQQ